MKQDNAMTTPFVDQYDGLKPALPGHALPWLAALRDRALDSFAETGLPTQRRESWKYTNLRGLKQLELTEQALSPQPISIDRAPSLLPDGSAYRVVFVNGGFRSDLSDLAGLPEGVTLGSVAELAESQPQRVEALLSAHKDTDDQPLVALNTAFMRDGLLLELEAGSKLDKTLEIIHVNSAENGVFAHNARNLISLAAGSEATILEHHIGLNGAAYYINAANDVTLAEGATLRHYRIQAEGENAVHTSTMNGQLAGDSFYDGFTLSIGAALSRNETSMKLTAAGARCHLNGGYLMRDKQHCDTTTVVDHLSPQTSCREVFKGVLDDRSRGVFQGRIVVHPQAQQTDGHQLNKVLLLTDTAEINAKPELEIYADDVKCSHGCSAGEVDHDALFYLRSRGLSEDSAKALLIKAFLAESVSEIGDEALHDVFLDKISDWLAV
ncbi:Fe-S cluster assembly protein SufD [Denitrobaculum tricleocarpae]|uniref:Fe-S cluster assembly protein SufD n=1 Tax=Denitrobaculum tricleocarpae TaxID=2591009 RepID=A0A545TPA0_9PROT|nr:Fe-S cluster assembly protein SufD [Denitrobaculum tricleocarpae]TQV79052.1 Fe-S cluster assembly protein SufD [Denitrobaculum tricleocarpae]